MKDTSVIAELKSSSERIGQLYPILVDHHGNIIDGEHRYGVVRAGVIDKKKFEEMKD